MRGTSDRSVTAQRGFTLIELLVVIGIIGVLAGLILVALNSTRARARDARIQANVSNTFTVCQLRNDATGNYDDCMDADSGVTSGEAGAIEKLDTDTKKLNATTAGLTISKPATPATQVCIAAQLNAKSGANTQHFCRDYTGNSLTTVNGTPCSATFLCQP